MFNDLYETESDLNLCLCPWCSHDIDHGVKIEPSDDECDGCGVAGSSASDK